MTPQERQLVDDLFDRLSKVESAPRDPDATAAITQGLRQRAQRGLCAGADRTGAGRGAEARPQPHPGTGSRQRARNRPSPAASSIPCATRSSARASRAARCRTCRRRDDAGRPVWNSGQVMQQPQRRTQLRPGQAYGQGPYGQPLWRAAAGIGGGGGSFLGTAAAAAAGVVGGSLLLNSIRGMMGGRRPPAAFGDTSGLGDRGNRESVERSVRQRARARCRHQRHRLERRTRRHDRPAHAPDCRHNVERR